MSRRYGEKISLKQHLYIKTRILKPNISKLTYVELLHFPRLSEKYLLRVSWRVLCYQCSPSPLRGTALLEQGIQLPIVIAIHQKHSRMEKLTWSTWATHGSGLSHSPQIWQAASTALSLCRSQAQPQAAFNTITTASCTHFWIKLLFEVKYIKLLWLEFCIAGDFSPLPFT